MIDEINLLSVTVEFESFEENVQEIGKIGDSHLFPVILGLVLFFSLSTVSDCKSIPRERRRPPLLENPPPSIAESPPGQDPRKPESPNP